MKLNVEQMEAEVEADIKRNMVLGKRLDIARIVWLASVIWLLISWVYLEDVAATVARLCALTMSLGSVVVSLCCWVESKRMMARSRARRKQFAEWMDEETKRIQGEE